MEIHGEGRNLEIETERLRIVALSWEAVGLCLGGEMDALCGALSGSYDITLASDLISDSSRVALRGKYEKMGRLLEKHHPWYTYWMMITKVERCGMGMVGFKGRPTRKGDVEIGYNTAPAYRGRGYMTEAVMGMIAWAFAQPYCEAVVAETVRENLASHRVLEKVGMRVSGRTTKMIRWRVEKKTEIRDWRLETKASTSNL